MIRRGRILRPAGASTFRFMRRTTVILLALGLVTVSPILSGSKQTDSRGELKPYATISHPPIAENSGIVRSRRYPDTYWVHNDSGDKARIFAIRADGTVIVPARANRREDAGVAPQAQSEFQGITIEGASNIDWEDIAIDGDTLYIADMGNNANARRDLGIYVLKEPNPLETDRSRFLRFLPVAYPDQKQFPPRGRMEFDCEAIFTLRGKIYAITKHRENRLLPAMSATLYRLDSQHTDKTNLLTRLDYAADLGGWVTAADVSPDGRTLAVLTQMPIQSVWLFDTSAPGDRFLTQGKGRQIRFTGVKQAESLCWQDGSTLIIGNEQRELFRLPVKR
jgi:hypothetical protein